MSLINLSERDKKELIKFKKYLVFKSLQVILQSRSGRKLVAQSKLISSGSDWFNLSVRDDSKVVDEIKKVYSKFGPDGLTCTSAKFLCLEFSLIDLSLPESLKKSVDTDTDDDEENTSNNCPLEIWRINMSDSRDENVRVMYGVYNRMSTLIKCLFSVSRVLPTYKLCRNLCFLDNLSLKYNIYSKKFNERNENLFFKSSVGSVPTPEGTIFIDVLYRKDVKTIIQRLTVGKSLTDINEDYYSKEIRKISSDECLMDAEIISISEVEDVVSSRNSSDDIISVERKDNGEIVIKDVHNKETIHMAFDHLDDEISESQANSNNTTTNLHLTNSPTVKIEVTEKSLNLSKADSELSDFYRECTTAPSLNLFVQSPTESKDVFEDLSSKLAEFEASAKQFDAFVNSIHG